MKNKATIWLYISMVLGYIWGCALILSLIFLPLGIYAISGANLYHDCTQVTDSELYCVSKRLTNWAIFFSIIFFPFGLLTIIPAYIASNNKIKVVSNDSDEFDANSYMANVVKENEANYSGSASPVEQRVVSAEDMEKFEELKKYKEQGLITEEEFQRAKHEIFG